MLLLAIQSCCRSTTIQQDRRSALILRNSLETRTASLQSTGLLHAIYTSLPRSIPLQKTVAGRPYSPYSSQHHSSFPQINCVLLHHSRGRSKPLSVSDSQTSTMCTRIIHQFSCGHRIDDDYAPCASSRTIGRRCPSSEMKIKVVKHDEKCDDCAP
jgi:hypothetical protein